MAKLFLPGYIFADSNNDPVNSGTVNFYDTGTTTDKGIFTDPGLTTAATNPAPLNSAGRFNQGDLYGTGTYTVVLKDSASTQIWSRDDFKHFQMDGQGADIASASALAVNIEGTFHDVTGTTTITSLAAVEIGTLKILQFDGIVILTHQATDLILPDATNITTEAGEVFTFYEYASGDWRLVGSSRAAITNIKGADLASAPTLSIGTDGNYFDVTGTTNISSFSNTHDGNVIKLHFDGVLTLAHHATNLILPSAQNFVTKAGDEIEFTQYAASDWRLTGGNRSFDIKGADIASASALPVLAPGYFDVTGTTTVTSIKSIGIGSVIKLHFDGALILTHQALDLILPGGANITTAAADEAEFVEYAAEDWRCTSYVKATGKAVILDPTAQATQAAIEAETNEDTYIPPDLLKHHPGIAKVWAFVDRSAGTPSLSSPSYNITSVTDDGAAQTIITINTDFSSAVYVPGASTISTSLIIAKTHTLVSGSFKVTTVNSSDATSDTVNFVCWAFGDQ